MRSTELGSAVAMSDPPAVPSGVGVQFCFNDGGPQHTAGAQLADSIAVPGAAAVSNLEGGRLDEVRSSSSDPKCMTAYWL